MSSPENKKFTEENFSFACNKNYFQMDGQLGSKD